MAVEQAEINDTFYFPESDMVIWVVTKANGERHRLAWARKYFHTSFPGFKNELSPELVKEFNEKMQGQTRPFDFGGAGAADAEIFK